MNLEPRIDIIASALADTSRMRMVCTMMDGRAFTNKELAYAAGITPQTATSHLTILASSGITSALKSGRCVYHRIKNSDVAQMIETLGSFTSIEHLKRVSPNGASDQIMLARSCYDHIAGRLGVLLSESLCDMKLLLIEDGQYRSGPNMISFLDFLGGDIIALEKQKRPMVRCCLDWTERRNHLAGGFGALIMDLCLQESWLERVSGNRALRVTPKGFEVFARHFNLSSTEITGELARSAKPLQV